MKRIFTGVSRKTILLLVLAITVFVGSFYIRWHDMATIPYGIEEDEYAWITTAQFHEKGIDASTKGIWFLHVVNEKNFPLSLWIHEGAFHLFGSDILSARKILAIVSVLSLVALFFFLIFFFTPYIAIALVAAYSFSTYKLISSKIALPSVYQELPMLCAFIFALLVQKYSDWKQYLCAFGAGVWVVLTLLSYNITYMVPVITFGFLLFGLLKQPFRWKRLFLCTLSYLLPILLFLPFFFSVINREFEAKQYIFSQSNTQTTPSGIFVTPTSLSLHMQDALNILWYPLTTHNSDMLLSYPYPMIPRLITLGAMVGFIISCIYWRKYWPLLCWILLQFIVYHIILGFNLPRTWFLTVGALYVLSGVTIQTVLHRVHHKQGKKFAVVLLLLCLFYLITSGIFIYFTSAIQYPFYKTQFREIFTIAKDRNIKPFSNILIVPEHNDSWLHTWNTALSFTYSNGTTQTTHMLNTYAEKDFGILTIDEFNNLLNQNLIPQCVTLIGEPFLVQKMYDLLKSQCSKQYEVMKYQKYWIALPK